MFTEAQQAAMIRTILYFMGTQNHAPTAEQVQAQLHAFNQQAFGGTTGGTGGPSTGGTTTGGGYDLGTNKNV
jgi:hypothetical protein